jgi:hypothetical protein
MSHSAKASSTIIRKKKAFPVMNVKKKLLATMSGNIGTRNKRPMTAFFKKVFDDFIKIKGG